MQCGLPPGAHTSCSLMLGHELPIALKAQPWCDDHPEPRREAWTLPVLCPGVPMGSRSPAFRPLPPAQQHAGDKQAARSASQTPLEKQKFLVTTISISHLGLSSAHGWAWDRMPGTLFHQCIGTGWGGLCLAWYHQSHCWKWGFCGKEPLLSSWLFFSLM